MMSSCAGDGTSALLELQLSHKQTHTLIQTAALAKKPRPRNVRIWPMTMPSQHQMATAIEKQMLPCPAAI